MNPEPTQPNTLIQLRQLTHTFNRQITFTESPWHVSDSKPSPEKRKKLKVRRRIEDLHDQIAFDKEYGDIAA